MEINTAISRDRRDIYTCTNRRDAQVAVARLDVVDRSIHRGTIVNVNGLSRNDPGVRIDIQNRFQNQDSGRRFVNLQIQINVPRNGRSTTIATAIVQTNERGDLLFPIRYVRDALLRSLNSCIAEQCRLILVNEEMKK